MIVASIRKDNINYYINLEQKDNKYLYYVIATSNEGNYVLSKEQSNILLNDMFRSKMNFLEQKKGYNIYIDEAGNKRYFRDDKENFYLLFANNGVDSTLYDSYGIIEKSRQKRMMFKNAKKVYKGFVSGFLLATIATSLIYPSDDFPIDISYYEAAIDNLIEGELTKEDISNYILTSNNKNLDEDMKDFIINEDLFNDLLSVADDSRNYVLRKNLYNFGILYFTEKEKEADTSLIGYYNQIHRNCIHLRDNSEDVFTNAAGHEFIHLIQDDNDYKYIIEASAEIMQHEYYGSKIMAYHTQVKRLYTLMEIIGPQAVLECNFKGDTSTFENTIINNLGQEDGERLLDLFKLKPSECNEEIDSEIGDLLSKMYKNIYNEDIEDNKLIKYINNSFMEYIDYDRIYFNEHHENYNNSFVLEFDEIQRINFDQLYQDGCYFYCYYKKPISETEYNVLLEDHNVFKEYDCIDGYEYDALTSKFLSEDGKTSYDEEEANEKGIITNTRYVEAECHLYKTYDDFKNADQSYYHCTVMMKNGNPGTIEKDEDENYILNHRVHITETIKPISEKFPEQVRNTNNKNTK